MVLRLISKELIKEIRGRLQRASQKKEPKKLVIWANRNPVNLRFLKIKQKVAQELGVNVSTFFFEEFSSQEEIMELATRQVDDHSIGGVVVQYPFESGYKETAEQIIEMIPPEKDVDFLTPYKLGQLIRGVEFQHPTSTSLFLLLNHYGLSLNQKDVALVGYGRIVGKPLSIAISTFYKVNSLTIFDKHSSSLEDKISHFDAVIVAVGKYGVLKASSLRENSIALDFGSNVINNQVRGDILYDRVDHLLAYSPVPGGLGPLAVYVLFANLLGVKLFST